MLIFPLKKEWYDKIRSGEKTIEYREVKPYWNKRFYTETKKHLVVQYGKEKTEKVFPSNVDAFMRMFDTDNVLFGDGTENEAVIWTCKLRLGYTNIYMEAQITKIEIVDGKDTDLHIDKPVYAIHLKNVRVRT